jgi:hypothetical protein
MLDVKKALGMTPDSWVLDENYEVGDNAPHERTDLAVGRTDLDELSVRTAFDLTAAKGPGTPGWCEHHKQNHHKNTKCPFMTGGGTSETSAPPEHSNHNKAKESIKATIFDACKKLGLGLAPSADLSGFIATLQDLGEPTWHTAKSTFIATIKGEMQCSTEQAESIFKQLTETGLFKEQNGEVVYDPGGESTSPTPQKGLKPKKIEAPLDKSKFSPGDVAALVDKLDLAPGSAELGFVKALSNAGVDGLTKTELLESSHLDPQEAEAALKTLLADAGKAITTDGSGNEQKIYFGDFSGNPNPRANTGWTAQDPLVVTKAMGWNVGGKGEAMLRTLAKAAEDGMTVEQLITAMPKPKAGSNKPNAALAKTLLDAVVDKGLASYDAKTKKYTLGVDKAKLEADKLKKLKEIEEKAKQDAIAAAEKAKQDLIQNKLKSLTYPPNTYAAGSVPKPQYASKPAPQGVPVDVHQIAQFLGKDLHNAEELKQFESSSEGQLLKKISNGVMNAKHLCSTSENRKAMLNLVNSGVIDCTSPAALFDETVSDAVLGATFFSKKKLPGSAQVAKFMPAPSKTELSYADGQITRKVIVSEELEDSIAAAQEVTTIDANAIKFMSTEPGRWWRESELAELLGKKVKLSSDLLESRGEGIRVKWRSLMAYSLKTGTKCPKCHVNHRDGHLCPGAPPPKTKPNAVMPSFDTLALTPAKPAYSTYSQAVAAAKAPMSFPQKVEVAVKAAKEMQASPGTMTHKIISLLVQPQNPSTIAAVLQNAGFKQSPASVLSKLVSKGIVVQQPDGSYLLSGLPNQTSELPTKPGEELLKATSTQPAEGVSEIRAQYPADHPIQFMSEKHAKMFHQLVDYYHQFAAPETNGAAFGTNNVDDIKFNEMLNAASSQIPKKVQQVLKAFAASWIGNSQSWAGQIFNGALVQMKITQQEFAGKSPAIQLNGSHSHEGFVFNSSDVEAPIKMKDGTPGPSIAEVVLHQYAMTQAACKAAGITSFTISRNVENKYGNAGIVSQMVADYATNSKNGGGGQLIANPLTSWSQKKLGSFGSFTMQKNTPVHLIFMHHQQEAGSINLFGSYTDNELELVAISQKCSSVAPITSTSGVVKFAQISVADSVDTQEPDKSLPTGLGKYVYRAKDLWWWITNNSVEPVYYVG